VTARALSIGSIATMTILNLPYSHGKLPNYERLTGHPQGSWVTGYEKDPEGGWLRVAIGAMPQPLEERSLQICCRLSIG
jgi:hypothetical protein